MESQVVWLTNIQSSERKTMNLAGRSRCVKGGARISGGINCLLWAQESIAGKHLSCYVFFFSSRKKLGDLSDQIEWTQKCCCGYNLGDWSSNIFDFFPSLSRSLSLSLSFCSRLSFPRGKVETGVNLTWVWSTKSHLSPSHSKLFHNQNKQSSSEELSRFKDDASFVKALSGNRLLCVLKLQSNI